MSPSFPPISSPDFVKKNHHLPSFAYFLLYLSKIPPKNIQKPATILEVHLPLSSCLDLLAILKVHQVPPSWHIYLHDLGPRAIELGLVEARQPDTGPQGATDRCFLGKTWGKHGDNMI